MIASLTLIVMMLAALGAGAGLLRATGTLSARGPGEAMVWSFALGVGIIGWFGFFLALGGLIEPMVLALACLVLVPGVLFLRPALRTIEPVELDIWQKALLAGFVVAACFDLLEGLSPPADADSLAYHFANPRLFLNEGHLVFIPRANTGATPPLQQMTYLIALGLGGERALTLWSMLTGWGATAMLYAVLRRHVGLTWSLSVTLVFLTTPAVIYGGGTGQVEIRNAMFVLAAAVAVAEALRTGQVRYAVLAGVLAGFYVGSKYPGLLVAFACGLALMFQRRWFVHGLVFSAFVAVAGGQGYAWNWINTGDPVFPLLFGRVDYLPGVPWDEAQHQYYSTRYRASEIVLPINPLSAVIYPFLATLNPPPEFEASVTGFGPFALLVLPLALLGAWQTRDGLARSPILVYAALCLISYLLWFFLGPSQRVRFLLPLYPLLLIALAVAAARAAENAPTTRAAVVVTVTGVIALQLVAHTVFSVNYARHVFTSEGRDAFYDRNVGRHDVVRWLNVNLSRDARALITVRELTYLMEIPVFLAHGLVEARVDTRATARDPEKFWRQLTEQGITHIVHGSLEAGEQAVAGLSFLFKALGVNGCLRPEYRAASYFIASRSLPRPERYPIDIYVVALKSEGCAFVHN